MTRRYSNGSPPFAAWARGRSRCCSSSWAGLMFYPRPITAFAKDSRWPIDAKNCRRRRSCSRLEKSGGPIVPWLRGIFGARWTWSKRGSEKGWPPDSISSSHSSGLMPRSHGMHFRTVRCGSSRFSQSEIHLLLERVHLRDLDFDFVTELDDPATAAAHQVAARGIKL